MFISNWEMKKKLDSCKKNYIEIMIDMKNIILY